VITDVEAASFAQLNTASFLIGLEITPNGFLSEREEEKSSIFLLLKLIIQSKGMEGSNNISEAKFIKETHHSKTMPIKQVLISNQDIDLSTKTFIYNIFNIINHNKFLFESI
jgi:hypothetical protein